MPVNRVLLLAAFLVTTPVNAEISDEVKATCMEAKDFVGCVKALSGNISEDSTDDLTALRSAMKQVAARLSSGTSLRDSTITFQPVIDQLALVSDSYPDELATKAASRAVKLFDKYQLAWQSRINSLYSANDSVWGNLYSCSVHKAGVASFNFAVGSEVVPYKQSVKSLIGIPVCNDNQVRPLEAKMNAFIVGVLKEGSVAPSAIKKYEADRSEKLRLANLSAWERHLDKNPGLKAWASANPSMANKEQAKFNAKNPQKQIQIPVYSETLRYLSKLNPPL